VWGGKGGGERSTGVNDGFVLFDFPPKLNSFEEKGKEKKSGKKGGSEITAPDLLFFPPKCYGEGRPEPQNTRTRLPVGEREKKKKKGWRGGRGGGKGGGRRISAKLCSWGVNAFSGWGGGEKRKRGKRGGRQELVVPPNQQPLEN